MAEAAIWPGGVWPQAGEVAEMYGQWRGPLLRYLGALGLPGADAEDVAQEVFLALCHHLRRGGGRENLRGWVFRVGHNLALRRREQMGRTVEAVEVSDPAPGPEELALLSCRRERLRAVVAALPERDRWCLLLRAEGLRHREIAEVVEISLGSVAASLGRAVGKLAAVEGR